MSLATTRSFVNRLLTTSLCLCYASCLLLPNVAAATPVVPGIRSRHASRAQQFQTTTNGDVALTLGNETYLANIQHPRAIVNGNFSAAAAVGAREVVPFTVIFVQDDAEVVTGKYLQAIVESYLEGDDVFSEEFLEGVLLARKETPASRAATTSIDSSALDYLNSLAPKFLLLDTTFKGVIDKDMSETTVTYVAIQAETNLTAGPYAAVLSDSSVSFGAVYRLYRDTYRTFLYGTYDANDGEGNFYPLELFNSRFWDPMIPVPSRIYSWDDPRPFAGFRVAIKDLFNMKGLVTSGGSQAWAEITEIANSSAPSIQRIINLGGVLVGKYKLAQFASGANPWDWQDEQYPFSPRGDGWLTCSASSSGGGCSVAAYGWLDFAIGSDTGSSMRRPAAVSGTYGNRPSQGLMKLQDVMPLGAATDTAGVFSRDVRAWAHFARHWYVPELHEDPTVTGLSPLEMTATNSTAFPRRVIYLTDYLPLRNPAAQEILQSFTMNMASIFGMSIEQMNLTAVVEAAPEEVPKYDTLADATGVINTITQYRAVAKPLTEAWAARYEGRFPPIDSARRAGWRSYNESFFTQALYDEALATKRRAVEWFERDVLFSTPESCSDGIMLWDIGTGGLPSYREEKLNADPDTTALLAVVPPGAGISGASLCPIYGCVDMTIPIGQVEYFSNVTYVTEVVPVTVSVIAKRGCDFMLWDMWERLADEGVLRTVNTGRRAF